MGVGGLAVELPDGREVTALVGKEPIEDIVEEVHGIVAAVEEYGVDATAGAKDSRGRY